MLLSHYNHYKKPLFWVLSLCSLLIVGYSAVVVSIDYSQYKQNQKIIANIQEISTPSDTLVIFFSRSGNTELMARKIAELKQAHIIPIQSKRNKIGFVGWLQSLQDARKTEAEISPNKIDLSGYNTIYIGSPIWLYSPAPAIFEFAKNNDFSSKEIILFNSMNSKFEQQYIDNFKAIIEENGGVFKDHLYIIRGRMTQQMDTEIFLKEVERIFKD